MSVSTLAVLLLAGAVVWLVYRNRRLGRGLSPLSAEHLASFEEHLEQLRHSGVVSQQECDEFRRQFQ
ncbi:hypothetical protein [Ferrimonas sediminicola]|nr:hypothetical protein [Ferrimonas sediminicola]